MKKVLIVSIIVSLSSCRSQPAEVSFSCTRLASCYSSYSSMVKDPQIQSLVATAQKLGDEISCNNAITQLSQSIGQECAF